MIKKGQVTIFVIIAIIVISVIAIIWTIKDKSSLSPANIPSEIEPIRDSVNNCLEQTAYNGAFEIGLSGGYYNKHLGKNESKIMIYLEGDNALVPSINTIEGYLSQYIEDNLNSCLANFSKFRDFNINAQKIKVTSDILKESALITLNYPLSITKDNSAYTLGDFEYKINVPIGKMLGVSESIVNIQLQNPDRTCLSCLLNLEYDTNLTITSVELNDNTLAFVILDNKEIKNKTYSWIFSTIK